MPPGMIDMVGAVLVVFLIGLFIILFPISRRLGGVLEEWMKLRREEAPDRDRMGRLEDEMREVRQHMDGTEGRLALLAERQEFLESLIEARKTAALPADRGTEPD